MGGPHQLTAEFVHSAVEGFRFFGVPGSGILFIYGSEMSQHSDKAWEIHLQTPGGGRTWEQRQCHLGPRRAPVRDPPSPSTSVSLCLPAPETPHPSGKKLSIMRSPRGFTASAPICCRSARLQRKFKVGRTRTEERGSTRGMRPDRPTDGQIEGGDHRSAPAPQVALLAPVQRPKPVVEAEQTGLRDCGRESRRVTDARVIREVTGVAGAPRGTRLPAEGWRGREETQGRDTPGD